MSDPKMNQLLEEVNSLVNQAEDMDELQRLHEVIHMQQEAASSIQPSTSQPSVRWIKRDSGGNIIYGRPRFSRKRAAGLSLRQTGKTGGSPFRAPETSVEMTNDFSHINAESFLQELKRSLGEDLDDKETPPQASSDWSVRKSLVSGWWAKVRPWLVDKMVAKQHVASPVCQKCYSSPAMIHCCDCRPHPFLCARCDSSIHKAQVFHNRDSIREGFFQPLPPTSCFVEKVLTQCVCLVPLEMPGRICSCPQSLSVITGKPIAVVTMNGRYDLNLPELKCEVCQATWSAGVDELVHNDYWPATSQFSTVYATDILFSFEELKMAAPGMSSQAFLRMLDQRTVRFGRTGKVIADSFRKSFLEWEAVRFEMDKVIREDHFNCPACTPNMLAVSVDGNRKHYRFKSAARSEEQAIFNGVFIAKDDDVARFVDYVHSSTSHVSGRGVCGGQWSAARETSQKSSSKVDEEGLELAVCRHGVLLCALNMFRGEVFAYPLYLQKKMACKPVKFFAMDVACKYWPYLQRVSERCPELQDLLSMKPFLSVFHAKAHDFKCEVKWSGAYQEGAGLTLGEEVEQCNAFLSRIAVTTKHMAKAGRTDMLTVMAMLWNQQKTNNLASTLARRYQKATIALQRQLHNMEAMKTEMAVTDDQLEGWSMMFMRSCLASPRLAFVPEHSVDLRTKRKAFDMVMAVRRLEEEKRIVIAEMEKYWTSLCTRADTLKEMSSQLCSGTSNEMWGLSKEGIQGLQSLIIKNAQAINRIRKHVKNCYIQVLTGTEVNFKSDSEEYHSDSELSED
ncbi:hypothetical protein IRJ41_023842 [Triplophysa rosa]|uniref:CxC3 like cysteine cluster domain-containing protein n=1 Tax=Triplophysa rosa TaxID=992332 RepID=A0A9W7TWT6_TRIRA|nr:hypothetical protein IRJ41_023842 [Triplophysa rosa]